MLLFALESRDGKKEKVIEREQKKKERKKRERKKEKGEREIERRIEKPFTEIVLYDRFLNEES